MENDNLYSCSHFMPKLSPVNISDAERPLWTVIIPTYNCAEYAREAIDSVLIQDPAPVIMQILVVDDGSDDHIEDVVKEMGNSRVEF